MSLSPSLLNNCIMNCDMRKPHYVTCKLSRWKLTKTLPTAERNHTRLCHLTICSRRLANLCATFTSLKSSEDTGLTLHCRQYGFIFIHVHPASSGFWKTRHRVKTVS